MIGTTLTAWFTALLQQVVGLLPAVGRRYLYMDVERERRQISNDQDRETLRAMKIKNMASEIDLAVHQARARAEVQTLEGPRVSDVTVKTLPAKRRKQRLPPD